MDEENTNPRADGSICDIKRGPVPATNIKIKKVNHFSHTEPINQIAGRTAKYEGKAVAKQGMGSGGLMIKTHNHTDGHRGHEQKQYFPHPQTLTCENPECTAHIVNMGDVKKIWNHADRLIQRHGI